VTILGKNYGLRRRLIGLSAVISLALTVTPTVAFASESKALSGVVLSPPGLPQPESLVRARILESDPSDGSTGVDYLASAVTDSQGRFTMDLPVTSDVISEAQFHGGHVNLELSAQAMVPSTWPDWSFLTGYLHFSAVYEAEASSLRPELPPEVQITLSESQEVLGDSLMTSSSSSCCIIPVFDDCYTSTTIVAESDPLIVVGEYHANWDVDGYLKYGTTADSDLGIGTKSGSSAWEVTGSMHVGNGRSGSSKWNRGPYFGKQLQSQFHYIKERVRQRCSFFGLSTLDHSTYVIRATKWSGGATEGTDVSNWDGSWGYNNTPVAFRQPYAANTEAHRAELEAHTYTAEIVVFGVTLSANSGYSTNVVMHWEFGSGTSRPHWLLGKDGPALEATIVYSY
jgi:hypothetical protein